MKRFGIFAGEVYYPRGGMDDFYRSSDSIEALEAWIDSKTIRDKNGKVTGLELPDKKDSHDGHLYGEFWWEIYDFEEQKTVKRVKEDT